MNKCFHIVTALPQRLNLPNHILSVSMSLEIAACMSSECVQFVVRNTGCRTIDCIDDPSKISDMRVDQMSVLVASLTSASASALSR
jgi:hypothetical protein